MKIFAAYAALLFLVCPAHAATVPVFSAPYDFALLGPQSPPPPGGPFAYAITGGTPSWNIASWDIPAGNLPTFVNSKNGQDVVMTSRSAEASIVVDHAPDGKASYELSQNGAVLPCGAAGAPRESDLFAGPYGWNAKPPEKNGLLIPAGEPLALTALVHLITTATIGYEFGDASPRHECAVSQGSPLISVILNNRIARQTLFYQLELGNVCGPQPAARSRMCEGWGAHPQASFFFRKNPFGVDEALPLFGWRWLSNHQTRTIQVDLLPHLINFVMHGPVTMDHNPAHWTVGGYYNGQHIWGGVTMTTSWKDLSLVAITR